MTKQVSNWLMHCKRTGWRWLAGSFVCALPVMAQAQTENDPAPKRCGTAEYEQILQKRDPNRLRQLNQLNRLLQQAERNEGQLRQQADEVVFRIPVVVHVVHNTASGETGGPTNRNISDEQVISQIQVLNEDYRRQAGTNGFNTSPIGADAGIEFFLAKTDPNGQPTNGITRHYYPQKTTFNVFQDDSLLSAIAYWPSDRYLNIWVTQIDEYLGYTQFPTMADTLSGLPDSANERVDGSIIDYRYFGRDIGTVRDPSYRQGRTATHEIGHWLGLLHTWGDGDGCAEDYVADTPPTKAPNQTRQCRETYSTCNGGPQTRDLTEDYMDYSPDACMNLFTKGQVARMRTVLALSPRRARLVLSAMGPVPESDNLAIDVYPNPAQSDPTVEVRLKGAQSFTVDVLDLTGRQVRSQQYVNQSSTRVSFSRDGLATGLYIVRVSTANERVSKRLLVQ
ncbi:M43 family zinc metalloprotease [Spirosoma knui]